MSTVYLIVIAALLVAIGVVAIRYELKARKDREEAEKRAKALHDKMLSTIKSSISLSEKEEELRIETDKDIASIASCPDGKSSFAHSVELLHGRSKRKKSP